MRIILLLEIVCTPINTILALWHCRSIAPQNEGKDMVFFVKNVFNQKLCTIYDSRVGKYIGFAEHCIKDADHFNNQAWKMRLRRIQVETVCRYNARLFIKSTLERNGTFCLISTLQKKPEGDFEAGSMLECSVWGFFPKEVSVSWLRDGVEVTTDVASTDVMANGDWSYQLHSYLEFTPRKWERVTCRVDHRSLRAAFFSRDLLHDIIVSIATSNSSSLHHDVHFLNYGPI
uniref:Ig-like domain-containing protein n=1 Tax=Sparus aurata TaxID=8175 RepID=A0A671WFI9_SPAAU